MWGAVAKVTLTGAVASAVALYALYPDRAPEIMNDVQLVFLKVAFWVTAVVLAVYLGYSWISSVRDSQRQLQRAKDSSRISDDVRRARLAFQLDALQSARKAEEEAQAQRQAAAAEAAARAREAKAAAALRQPGGGGVSASPDALAHVRVRQQQEAQRVLTEVQERQREQGEEARARAAEEAGAAAAAARAESAARQPGGGAVHASVSSMAPVRRERQQEATIGGRQSAEGSRRRAAGAAGAAVTGGAGAVGAAAAARAGPPGQRVWDGPIFPGDELRGWVSPASEEAARVRAQQDAELERSLQRDRAREEVRLAKEREAELARERKVREQHEREERRAILLSLLPPEPESREGWVSIAARLPDSTVHKRFWLPSNTIGDLYNWVESMEMVTRKKFQLVTPFPREVLDREVKGSESFTEASLCPQALVVVELLDD